MRAIDRYPEFTLWDSEGLIKISNYGGRQVFRGTKLRYLRHIQSVCFDRSGKNNAGASKADNHTVPTMQLTEEAKDRARHMFKYVEDENMRRIMWDLIVTLEIKSARAKADAERISWPNFVDLFDRSLVEIIENVVL